MLPSPLLLPLIHRATAREKLDRNVETKRRGNVLATTSTQSRNSVEDEIWRKKRGRGREREARRKKRTPPSLALLFSSPLLSSSRCYSTLSCSRTFPLPIPRLVPSWHPKFALRNPPGWLRRPPSIHPFFAPRKANDLLFSWLDLASSRTNNTRSGHVACTCIHTALFIRETLLSIFLSLLFLSSRDRDEWKSNGEYDSMTDGGTVDYYF